jgi:hypothetical protein
MPILSMKRSIILQFKELVKALSEDKSIKDLEPLFTNRLYQFYTHYCKFPTHNNKEMFFKYYFCNPYNLKELFNIFLDDLIDKENCEILSKSQRDTDIIKELYSILDDVSEELYTVIESKILDFTLLKCITLLDENNFIIDWSDGTILYEGIDNKFTRLSIKLLGIYYITVDLSKKIIYCEEEMGVENLKRLRDMVGIYEKDPFEYNGWEM